jgi:hypothetical protein
VNLKDTRQAAFTWILKIIGQLWLNPLVKELLQGHQIFKACAELLSKYGLLRKKIIRNPRGAYGLCLSEK